MAERPKNLVVLGSTGTVGSLALELAGESPDRFRVIGLAAGRNAALLAEQVARFRPRLVSVADEGTRRALERRLGGRTESLIRDDEAGLVEVASLDEADLVVSAIVGFAGLAPTLAALQAGKTVALACKESLVAGGPVVMKAAQASGALILPVDSEHSAIFQVLAGQRRHEVRRVVLTASGGPFCHLSAEELTRVTAAQALAHPTWVMGPKITIDSASLMNKGLEVIEACWLFDLGPDQIEMHIHRQSVVHSAVEFIDGSILAQMGVPDMRLPLAFALHYPQRAPVPGLEPLDLFQVGRLTFERPDFERFPCPRLALEAARAGQGAPAALNAADEVAVAAFLEGRIGFTDIPTVIQETLAAHRPRPLDDLEAILDVDASARRQAGLVVERLAGSWAGFKEMAS